MRPVNEEGKFTIATDVKDGKVRVVVTALDKNDEFLNFLNMTRRRQRAGAGEHRAATSARKPPAATSANSPPTRRAATCWRQHRPGQHHAADRRDGALLGRVPRAGRRTRPCSTTLASIKPTGGEAGKLIEGELKPGRDRPAGRLGRYVPPHAGQGHQQPGFLADLPADRRRHLPGRRVHPPRHGPFLLGRAGPGPRLSTASAAARRKKSATSGWSGCATARPPWPASSTSAAPPPASSRRPTLASGRRATTRTCWPTLPPAPAMPRPGPSRSRRRNAASRAGHLHRTPAGGEEEGEEGPVACRVH